MLNAFRHHGERDDWVEAQAERGTPVLNAFRHHGERDYLEPLPQRELRVLNAFRHHGERDPS